MYTRHRVHYGETRGADDENTPKRVRAGGTDVARAVKVGENEWEAIRFSNCDVHVNIILFYPALGRRERVSEPKRALTTTVHRRTLRGLT